MVARSTENRGVRNAECGARIIKKHEIDAGD